MNKDERSAASTGADSERHRSNDLNPASAPALSLPIQRLGSAMEGLPELKQLLCDIGMSLADREYVANRWASEVEALRQRPGAQAPSTAAPTRERLHELARVCFDAGIAHGRGAKNCWITDGKALAIIDQLLAAPSTGGAETEGPARHVVMQEVVGADGTRSMQHAPAEARSALQSPAASPASKEQ